MSIFKRNKDAIYIELKPRVDKNYWGGDVELNIICNPESKLDEDSRIALLHLAQLVSCAIPVMDDHPYVATIMENYLIDYNKTIYKKHKNYDNVIAVDFKNKGMK
tara:strand:- start:297 stop:611 length:315 start_codon:yes stop_codon:yes gene_type:complete